MNSNSNKKTSIGGIGIVTVLQIVFLVLKFTKLINWSWFWVLSPLWIWAGIMALLFMLIGICQFLQDKTV